MTDDEMYSVSYALDDVPIEQALEMRPKLNAARQYLNHRGVWYRWSGKQWIISEGAHE